MTGNQLRTYRIQAGLLSEMLAKRLGVATSTVSRSERCGDLPFASKKLRAALKSTKLPFENWTRKRDGVRNQKPHMAKRGEGRLRDKTHPKTTGAPSVKKRVKTMQPTPPVPKATRKRQKARAADQQEISLNERDAAESAKTLGREAGETPKGAQRRLSRAATRREQFAAIEKYGGCTKCGGAPRSNVNGYTPDWNDVVVCDKCGYAAISLWKWCGRTGAPRPPMEKPKLGKAPSYIEPLSKRLGERSRKCARCEGKGRLGPLDVVPPTKCEACEGTGCVPEGCPPADIDHTPGRSPLPTTPAAQDVTNVPKPRKPNFSAMTFEQGEEVIRLLTVLTEVWK